MQPVGFARAEGACPDSLAPVFPGSVMVKPGQPIAHLKREISEGACPGRPAYVFPLAAMVHPDGPTASSETGRDSSGAWPLRSQEGSVPRRSAPVTPLHDGAVRQAHRAY